MKPALAALSAYSDSDSDSSVEATEAAEASASKKQQRSTAPTSEAAKVLAWPLEWAWLMSRTHHHADFRPPSLLPDSCYAPKATDEPAKGSQAPRLAVSLATSVIYAGDSACGYDPRHLGRVAVVDSSGDILLDYIVKPRAPILDCRTHLTGLTREMLHSDKAVPYDTARERVVALLRSDTLLVGYRLYSDFEALRLWHGPLIDTALLFGVDSRKQHQYHPLRCIAERVLGDPEYDESRPHDTLESARLAMRLAQHEAKQSVPTPAFTLKEGNGCELLVRHIPREWGPKAAAQVTALCPGAKQGVVVNWLLNDSDPTEWRGEATLEFPSAAVRDAVFEGLKGLTDIHVQWEDAPGAPPLGSFLTEQGFMQAFSRYGMVVSARIPRKPITREPQSFAFISFFEREDAQRVARNPTIDVQITDAWMLPLRPRIAKFGNANDKRVAVKAGVDEFAFDWIHVCRR